MEDPDGFPRRWLIGMSVDSDNDISASRIFRQGVMSDTLARRMDLADIRT